MNKETKRQHYVPRTYLQKFTITKKSQYYITAADKDNLKNVFQPNVTNVCLETDMYTLSGRTPEERAKIDKFYSENTESIYNDVYQTLIDESVNQITEDMHYKVILIVITMLYRTSKWIHIYNNFIDNMLEQAFLSCQKNQTEHFIIGEEEYSIKGKTLEDIKTEFRKQTKDNTVLMQLDTALELINIRKYSTISISKLLPEYQFITSDNPVISSPPTPPFDPNNYIRIPIDSSHLLTILPNYIQSKEHYILRRNFNKDESEMNMMTNNVRQLSSAYKHILGEESAINFFIENIEQYKTEPDEEGKELIERINKKLI